jgi:prolyl-tRNA editing enzyme YbaK/EbsC (Cys-tRNA(Pro) deacylase)
MTEETGALARRVQEHLAAAGIAWHMVTLSSRLHTARETAQALGCRLEQIVKSLVFRGTVSNSAVLVLASGPNRVNQRTLSVLVAEPVQQAEPAFVQERTGFAVGSVPPVGHREPVVTFIDADLLQCEELWAGTGMPNTVCRLRPTDLVHVSGGRVVTIT